MTKIVQFTKDWNYSPNGYEVQSFKAGDVIEMDDAGTSVALSDEVAKPVSDAALKKAQAARDQLLADADKAEADADAAEKAAVEARAAAVEARRVANGARVQLAEDASVE